MPQIGSPFEEEPRKRSPGEKSIMYSSWIKAVLLKYFKANMTPKQEEALATLISGFLAYVARFKKAPTDG